MSVLSITTLKANIAEYKLLIQSGAITPDFEGKMLEDITDTLNALISASSTIAGFIDYNSAAPTPSVSSKYQFKSAGAAPSYISGQTTNVKVGDGLFVVKNGAAYTYIWEDKGVNSVELQYLRTELLGITDALNLAKQSKSDATLQTNDKTVSGAINETYNRITTTQYGTGNLVLNPWINITGSDYFLNATRSVNISAGVKYKLTVCGYIGLANESRNLKVYIHNSNWDKGYSIDIYTHTQSEKKIIFTFSESGIYDIDAYCYPNVQDQQTATILYYKVEVLNEKEPLPYQTTETYGNLLTIANNVNIEEGEINYWGGQLISRFKYNNAGAKIGIYQFLFSSVGFSWRLITFGNPQIFPNFTSVSSQITELSGNISAVGDRCPAIANGGEGQVLISYDDGTASWGIPVNNLTTNSSLSGPLNAQQGYVLKQFIDGIRQSLPTEWYVDVNAAIASGKTSGANTPTWSTFTANTNAFTFALNDYIDLQTVEIPHGYKEGSDIQMHLHLATNGTNTTERKVKYQVFFTYVQPDTGTHQFIAEQNFVAELTIPANTPDKSSFVLQMGIISDANMKFGNQVKMRIKRIAGTGTEPTGNPFLGQIGLHCLCNAVGTLTMQP